MPVAACAYQDYTPTNTSGVVDPEPTDKAYPSRQVFLQDPSSPPTYSVEVDRAGGAIYEFYSLRGTDTGLAPGHHENAVYANYGAAFQIALFNPEIGELSPQACGPPSSQQDNGTVVWNPTQAGTACSEQADGGQGPSESPLLGTPEGPTITCDGVVNNAATICKTNLDVSFNRMMNWDYGPAYLGPYGSQDTVYLHQAVTPQPGYLQVDVDFQDRGGTNRGLSPMPLPILYYTNRFHQVDYPRGCAQVDSYVFPDNTANGNWTTADLDLSFSPFPIDGGTGVNTLQAEPDWVTMENTGPGSTGYAITSATFFGTALRSAIDKGQHYTWNGNVFTTWQMTSNYAGFLATDYANVAVIDLDSLDLSGNTVTYSFRYVLFPYRHDETITTQFGTLSVANTIHAMRSAYASALAGSLDAVSDGGEAIGWALDQDNACASATVSFFLDGPLDAGLALGSVSTSLPRPDINAQISYPGNPGFAFSMPSAARDGLQHALYAYAISPLNIAGLSGSPLPIQLAAQDAGPVDAGSLRPAIDAGEIRDSGQSQGPRAGCGCALSARSMDPTFGFVFVALARKLRRAQRAHGAK
jgi:hypothetical protein